MLREERRLMVWPGRAAIVVLLVLVALVAACGSPNTPTPSSPVVSAVTPTSGPAAGGTSVTITGSNFAAGASVAFGGVLATGVVVQSAGSITATTAAHSAGLTDVTVTVSGRSGSLPGAFTYVAGAPPSISSITVRGSKTNEPANFADIGEALTVTAVVQDTDTSADRLTYDWRASAGTFSGSGARVQWTAPSTTGTARLTLVVSDGSTPVTGTADVKVHDSAKEVGDLARQFLLDFSDSSIKDANYVLRNFSTSSRCIADRDSEYSDIVKNREHYLIESYSIGSATVTINFASKPCAYGSANGDACAVVPSRWNALCLKTFEECKAGERGVSDGLDYVAAVYEGAEWKLCSSVFKDKNGVYRPNFIR